MSTAAIIAEYNPFHTGHQYQIEQIRNRTGADNIIIIMSGNYVQRGCPAITDKYTRTRMALSCGADLVIELPVFYSCASAKDFAAGAVNLIHQCGIVDYLCFGCETDNINMLQSIADIIYDEPDDFKQILKENLSNGISFAESRTLAILSCIPDNSRTDTAALLNSPNAILGIEYLCALKQFSSSITPFIIKRDHSYHSQALDTQFASASGIRNALLTSSDLYINHIPENIRLFYTTKDMLHTLTEDDYSKYLNYSLIMNNSLSDIYDLSEDLTHSIYNHLYDNTSFSDLSHQISGKHTTVTHCNRALLHILLNITESEMQCYKSNGYNQYLRILGFKKEKSEILKQIKTCASIPLISKLADSHEIINDIGLQMLSHNIKCDNLYRITMNKLYDKEILYNEFRTPIIII